jgi:hypothetical protein
MTRARTYPRSILWAAPTFWALACLSLFNLKLSWAAGTDGGSVLSAGVGARAIAMGEAYTAASDDVSSLYWNPAGVGLLNQSQSSFMQHQAMEGLSVSHLSVATPLENGGIGASLSYMSFGKIDGYDVTDQPTGNVSAYSGVGTLSAAFYSGQSWAAGANIKAVQESLADVKANGFATDLGLTYMYPESVLDGTVRLAATIRNLGTGLKFIEQRDPFPTEFRVGAALIQTLDRRLTLSADIGKRRDSAIAGYTGIEYKMWPSIAARAGWAGTDQEGTGLRAGIGLRVKNLSFDYAYSPYGDLGMSNLFEVSLRFGAIRPMLSPEERKMLRRAKWALSHERYDEATLLFSSLIDLVPNYRPLKRYLKVAMKDLEEQERQREAVGTSYRVAITNPQTGRDNGEDVDDLERLLLLGEGTQLAGTPSTKPSSTAPPLDGRNAEPLRVEKEGSKQ